MNEEVVVFREVQKTAPLPKGVVAFAMASIVPLLLWNHASPTDFVFSVAMETLFSFALICGLLGRITTTVRGGEVEIRSTPFGRRQRIDIREVRDCRAVDYSPVAQLLGIGSRRVRGRITSYLTRSSQAVVVESSTGDRVLIGSERASELVRVIETASREAGGAPKEK